MGLYASMGFRTATVNAMILPFTIALLQLPLFMEHCAQRECRCAMDHALQGLNIASRTQHLKVAVMTATVIRLVQQGLLVVCRFSKGSITSPDGATIQLFLHVLPAQIWTRHIPILRFVLLALQPAVMGVPMNSVAMRQIPWQWYLIAQPTPLVVVFILPAQICAVHRAPLAMEMRRVVVLIVHKSVLWINELSMEDIRYLLSFGDPKKLPWNNIDLCGFTYKVTNLVLSC